MRWAFLFAAAAWCACAEPTTPGVDAGPAATSRDSGPSRCTAGAFESASGACQPAGWTACDGGFERAADGWSCLTSPETCPAGTAAVPGRCFSAGWNACPAGFTLQTSGEACVPVLPAAACTGSTRAALDSTTCAPVGDCAAPFPPSAASLFVEPDAGAGPVRFGSISAALAAAPAGATIAIADGTWRETLRPTKPVTLVGRCPARVTLIGAPALEIIGTRGVVVEGVTVRDSLLAARLESGGQLTLRRVVLEGNERSAVQALDRSTEVTLDEVVVRGTRADSTSGTFGQGVALGAGARVVMSNVELRDNGETGVFLNQAGTSGALTNVVISATRPRASTGRLGWGLSVQAGATLTAERVVLDGNRAVGLLVAQRGSRATLTDVVVRDVGAGADNAGTPVGLGVSVQGGALSWTGGLIERVAGGFLDVQGVDGTATVSNVTARTSLPGPAARFGVQARNGASLTLERCDIGDAPESGVLAINPGSRVTLSDVRIHDVDGAGVRAQEGRVSSVGLRVERAQLSGLLVQRQGVLQVERCAVIGAADGGHGASAGEGGSLSVSDCLMAGATTAGVYLRDVGTTAALSRLEVRDTRRDANGEFGQGVLVESGATADLEDVAVVRAATAGLQVQEAGSSLVARRVTVQSTQPNAQGTRGRGVNVSFGATLTASETAFLDNQQVGVFVFDARVELIDSFVQGTRADPDGRYGNGVQALTDGVLTVTRGAIDGSAGLGAAFAEAAGVIDGARLSRNGIGIHTQDGSTLEEKPAPAMLGRRQVVVTPATVFVGNDARTGAEQVPVPPR
ncbi:MAG: right-handed parallel beta-helix repeat-containing protein [Myxococcaceae bacterium]|nr:right-handed parallel beta-helix repeat-containing protein [Myxococcaceae bacterium]